jgi:hypothetical protein
MQKLLNTLRTQYPELKFSAGKQFCWSPETSEIFYKKDLKDVHAVWSLLHETGHALLGHANYYRDFELLKLEVAAWEQAEKLAMNLNISIDIDHIQDCLDTYRDWLYKRSICPICQTKCLQMDDHSKYHCFNCHTVWKVSSSRFCRAYRSTKNLGEPSPVFHQFNTN